MSVVVKIPRGATVPAALQINPCRQPYVREFAVAQVAQQSARSIRHSTHEEKIRFAVAIVVKEAGACARPDRGAITAGGLSDKRIRLHRKSHWNRHRDIGNRTARQFGERISPLISVACAERHSQMLRRNFLETRQMFPRRSGIALSLKRPRQSELCRSMIRVES